MAPPNRLKHSTKAPLDALFTVGPRPSVDQAVYDKAFEGASKTSPAEPEFQPNPVVAPKGELAALTPEDLSGNNDDSYDEVQEEARERAALLSSFSEKDRPVYAKIFSDLDAITKAPLIPEQPPVKPKRPSVKPTAEKKEVSLNVLDQELIARWTRKGNPIKTVHGRFEGALELSPKLFGSLKQRVEEALARQGYVRQALPTARSGGRGVAGYDHVVYLSRENFFAAFTGVPAPQIVGTTGEDEVADVNGGQALVAAPSHRRDGDYQETFLKAAKQEPETQLAKNESSFFGKVGGKTEQISYYFDTTVEEEVSLKSLGYQETPLLIGTTKGYSLQQVWVKGGEATKAAVATIDDFLGKHLPPTKVSSATCYPDTSNPVLKKLLEARGYERVSHDFGQGPQFVWRQPSDARSYGK